MSDANKAAKLKSSRRGKPFEAGNTGRPKGSRNKATIVLEALLEGKAEAVIEKLYEMGMKGNAFALRFLADRALGPARRDRLIEIDLPTIKSASDVATAISVITDALASGKITPDEAAAVSTIVAKNLQAIEALNLESRVKRLEELHIPHNDKAMSGVVVDALPEPSAPTRGQEIRIVFVSAKDGRPVRDDSLDEAGPTEG